MEINLLGWGCFVKHCIDRPRWGSRHIWLHDNWNSKLRVQYWECKKLAWPRLLRPTACFSTSSMSSKSRLRMNSSGSFFPSFANCSHNHTLIKMADLWSSCPHKDQVCTLLLDNNTTGVFFRTGSCILSCAKLATTSTSRALHVPWIIQD